MKWLDRIFNKVKQKSLSFFSTSLGGVNGIENFYDALNLQTYKESLYLFIGVSMIRDTVSGIPVQMYRILNSDGDVEEVYDDPFLDLIERPNYRQTRLEFMKLAVSYYLLAGETFWYMEREGEKSLPTAMVNMRPDFVEILFNSDKTQIVAYEFRKADGTTLKIAPEDVLHIKNIDPTNPARGVGVIRPATTRILTEKEASKYQASTFKSQGRPDIAVFTDADPFTDEMAEDSRTRWDKIYNSGKERKAAGFFGAAVKDIKLLNVSPKEMDGIESMKFLREDILNALRIPKQMIEPDVNYANSRVAYSIYLKNACEPVIDTFYDVINNRWLTDQSSMEDKFLDYDTEVGEDREMILKEAVESKRAGIVNQNEARQLLGWPMVEGGDDFDEPVGMFQLSMKKKALRIKAKRILAKRSVLKKKFAAVRSVADMYRAEKAIGDVKREQNSVFYTEEMKQAYVRAYHKSVDNRSKIFLDTINFYNDGLYKRIIKQMQDFGVNPENVFDATIEIVEAKKIFNPLMLSLYKKAGQDTMDAVANGFSSKASEQFYTVDDVILALEARAEFFILSMLDTDYRQLRDIIAQGLADGIGVEEIGRNLRGYFDDMSVARARTIARTETGRLVSMATDEAYRQSSVVTGKEWLTARDSNVRPYTEGKLTGVEGSVNDHWQNEGTIVAPGGTFKNGERFPGELTINCRCALAPAV